MRGVENALPSGQSTRLRVERSGFETGAGSMCCVLRLNTSPPPPPPHTMLLFTQKYKWVPANCHGNLMKCWGITLQWTIIAFRGGEVVILLVASLHGNQDKLQLGGPIGWVQTLLLIKYEESRKMNTCTCCSQLYKHYSWLLMIRTFQNTIVFFFLVRCLFKSVRLL